MTIKNPDLKKLKSYNGNLLLKGANQQFEWTPELAKEWIKCSKNPVYFIEKYMKIVNVNKGLVNFKLYKYQHKMIDSFHKNRNTICCTARQAGKSISVCGYLLWYVLFNKDKTVALLANKGDTAREILGKVRQAYQHLPKWLQQGVAEWNKGSLELENNSRIIATSTSSDSIRGYTINCVIGATIITVRDKETGYINILSIDELEKDIIMKDNNYGFVYITTNLINGKQYIGAHRLRKENDGYVGSGKLLKKAIEKYGKNNFQQEILYYASNEELLFEKEKFYIKKYNAVEHENFYNISEGGISPILFGKDNGFYGKTHTDITKDKISKIHKNKIISSDHKEKITIAGKLRWSDPIFIEKMKNRKARPKFTEEQKRQHSEKLKGRIISEETKTKISKTKKEYFSCEDNLNKHINSMKTRNNDSYQTEEFKDQARNRLINYNKSEEKRNINKVNQTGKSLSEETKTKISEKLKKYHEKNIHKQ